MSKRTWAESQIAKMSPDEYSKNRDEIMEALREGRIQRDRSVQLGSSIAQRSAR